MAARTGSLRRNGLDSTEREERNMIHNIPHIASVKSLFATQAKNDGAAAIIKLSLRDEALANAFQLLRREGFFHQTINNGGKPLPTQLYNITDERIKCGCRLGE